MANRKSAPFEMKMDEGMKEIMSPFSFRSSIRAPVEDDIHPQDRVNIDMTRHQHRVFQFMRWSAGFGSQPGKAGGVEHTVRQLLIVFAVAVTFSMPPREPLFEVWAIMFVITSYTLWILRGKENSVTGTDGAKKTNRRLRTLINTVSIHKDLLEEVGDIITPIPFGPVFMASAVSLGTWMIQMSTRVVQWYAQDGGDRTWWRLTLFIAEQVCYLQVALVNVSGLCMLMYILCQIRSEARSLYNEIKKGVYTNAVEYTRHHSSITKRIEILKYYISPLVIIVVAGGLLKSIQAAIILYVFKDAWSILFLIANLYIAFSPAVIAADINSWGDSILPAAYRVSKFDKKELDVVEGVMRTMPVHLYLFGIKFTYSGFSSLIMSFFSIAVPVVYATLRQNAPSFITQLKDRYRTL